MVILLALVVIIFAINRVVDFCLGKAFQNKVSISQQYVFLTVGNGVVWQVNRDHVTGVKLISDEKELVLQTRDDSYCIPAVHRYPTEQLTDFMSRLD